MNFDDLTRPDIVGQHLADATGDARWTDLGVSLIAGGKSNLTFELSSAAGSMVLRRPPTGELLPRAHDMGREARVQRALASTDVPVPQIVLEDRGDILGVPFYIMEKVDGHVLNTQMPTGYAESDAERQQLCDALVDTLVELHAVSPAAVGLADYGRPEAFMQRQVRTWTRQWAASKSKEVPVVTELARRLAAIDFIEPPAASVVHGDYRLDNCIFTSNDPGTVSAILDWELSTLGDPLADLAMLLFYWSEPGERPHMLTPSLTASGGFSSRAELAERYAQKSGRGLDGLDGYLAFAHFKFAVIAQGIAARVSSGSMAGQEFGDLDDEVLAIAERGLQVLSRV